MSCRVLKRDLEQAMTDALVDACRARGVTKILGYYYPTAKNAMVRDFYGRMGYTRLSLDEEGNSVWELAVAGYKKQNTVITVREDY